MFVEKKPLPTPIVFGDHLTLLEIPDLPAANAKPLTNDQFFRVVTGTQGHRLEMVSAELRDSLMTAFNDAPEDHPIRYLPGALSVGRAWAIADTIEEAKKYLKVNEGIDMFIERTQDNGLYIDYRNLSDIISDFSHDDWRTYENWHVANYWTDGVEKCELALGIEPEIITHPSLKFTEAKGPLFGSDTHEGFNYLAVENQGLNRYVDLSLQESFNRVFDLPHAEASAAILDDAFKASFEQLTTVIGKVHARNLELKEKYYRVADTVREGLRPDELPLFEKEVEETYNSCWPAETEDGLLIPRCLNDYKNSVIEKLSQITQTVSEDVSHKSEPETSTPQGTAESPAPNPVADDTEIKTDRPATPQDAEPESSGKQPVIPSHDGPYSSENVDFSVSEATLKNDAFPNLVKDRAPIGFDDVVVTGLTVEKPDLSYPLEYVPRETVIQYALQFAEEFREPLGLHKHLTYPSEGDMRYLAYFKNIDSEEEHTLRRKLYFEDYVENINRMRVRADSMNAWFEDYGIKRPKDKAGAPVDPYHGIGMTFLLGPKPIDPALVANLNRMSRNSATTHKGSHLGVDKNGNISGRLPLSIVGRQTDPEEYKLLAKMIVLESQSRGWDHIEVKSRHPQMRQAIINEAKEAGMMVTEIGFFGKSRTHRPVDGTLPPMQVTDTLDFTRTPQNKNAGKVTEPPLVPKWQNNEYLRKVAGTGDPQKLPDPKPVAPDPQPSEAPGPGSDDVARSVGALISLAHWSCLIHRDCESAFPKPNSDDPHCPWNDPTYEGHIEGHKAYDDVKSDQDLEGIQMMTKALTIRDAFLKDHQSAEYSTSDLAGFMTPRFFPNLVEKSLEQSPSPEPA